MRVGELSCALRINMNMMINMNDGVAGNALNATL